MRAQIALSGGVLGLGMLAAAVTLTLPTEGGYAQIGPAFMPALVAAGLILLGAWLLYEALTGGWRRLRPPQNRGRAGSFLWVSAGLFAHMALIATAGFVIAGTVLFCCVARGFGSRRPARDIAVGFLLALAVYLFFSEVLGVGLPAGWMPFQR